MPMKWATSNGNSRTNQPTNVIKAKGGTAVWNRLTMQWRVQSSELIN
jgi:hypothetical protein